MPWDEADFAVLEEYVLERAEEVGLGGWKVEVLNEDPDDGHGGEANFGHRGKREVRFTFAPKLRDDAEEFKRTVAHELIHPHFEEPWNMVEYDLHDLVGRPAWTVFDKSFHNGMERAIDAVAIALGETYPDVQWPDPEAITTEQKPGQIVPIISTRSGGGEAA